MMVACPSCAAQYEIDEARVPPGGVKLKCPKCQTIIPVLPGGRSQAPQASVPLPGGGGAGAADEGSGSVPLPGGGGAGAADEGGGDVPLPGGGEAGSAYEGGGDVPLPGGEEAGAADEGGGSIPLPGGGEAGSAYEGGGDVPLPGGGGAGSAYEGGGDVPLPGEAPGGGETGDEWDDFGNVSLGEETGMPGATGEASSGGLEDFGNVDPGAGEPPPGAGGDFDPFGGSEAASAQEPTGAFDPFSASGEPLAAEDDQGLDFDPASAPMPGGPGDGLSLDPGEGSDLEFDIGSGQAPAPAPESAEEDMEILDFIDEQYDSAKSKGAQVREAGPARYRVKRKSGKTFGPFDPEVVITMLKEGQLLGNEEVSLDGASWKPIGSEAAFAEAIQALMESPASAQAPAFVPTVSDEPEEEETERDTTRKGKGYGVFSMSPTAARKASGAQGASKSLLKRWPILAGGTVALAVVGFGIYLGFTPYGWFGHRLVFSDGVGSRAPEATVLIERAREGIAVGTWKGLRDALESTQTALAADDRNTEARALFSQAAFHLERLYGGHQQEVQRATAYLREMEVTAANHPEHLKARMSRALLEGDAGQHRGDLEGVVAEDPDEIEALYLLGKAHFSEGNLEEAAKVLDRVADMDSGSAKAFHALGRIHDRLEGENDREIALMFFSRALEADPNHLASAIELSRMWLVGEKVDHGEAEAKLALVFESAEPHLAPSELARAHFLRGILFGNRRMVKEARAEFEKGLELHDDPFGRVALGRLLARRGNFEEAAEHFEIAHRADPGDLTVAAEFVEVLIQAGRMLDATRSLREFEQKAGGDVRVPFLRGLLTWSQGDTEEAEAQFREALSINARYHRAALALGRLYLELRRVSRAEQPIRAAVASAPEAPEVHIGLGDYLLEIHRPGEALESFEKALEIDDEDVDALIGTARAHAAMDQDDEAIEVFERAAEIEPDYRELAFHRGTFRWQREDLEKALEDLTRAHQQDENDPAIRARLGAVLYDMDRVDEAGRHLQAAATLAGNVGETFYYLGLVLARQGDRRSGIDRMRRAITIEPENSRFVFALGRLHEEGREYNEALFNYGRAIELDPRYVDAWLRTGDVHAMLNRYRDAVDAYERARRFDPENPEILMRLADTHVKWGRPRDAINWYERTIRLDPDIEGVHLSLARTLQTAGNHQRAVTVFQQAARREPDNPAPHYFLGYAFKDRGNTRQAITHFRAFLERADDEHPHRREVEDEIYDLRR